jgi:uncharacterized protein (TIGR03435 family)
LSNAIICGAQADRVPSAGDKAFAVVSIKRNLSASSERTVLDGPKPGGRWTLVNGTVLSMIGFAYVPGQAEIVGLPSWVKSERYDVDAKADGPVTVQEMRMMVRALLAERLAFRMHMETRRQRSYSLELARADRTLGPTFRRVDVDCPRIFEQTASGEIEHAEVEKASNGAPRCTITTAIHWTPMGSITTLKSGGTRLAPLLAAIGTAVGRPVVDKTGLDGYYEFTLEFASSIPAGSDAASAPTIFTALRDQLALKLVSGEDDLPVFVVDRLDRPRDN